MSAAQTLRTLTRQRLFALALVCMLLSAQMLGLGHAIAHGLGGQGAHQWSAAENLSSDPVDFHHSCAAFEAATVAGVLTQAQAPLGAPLLSFSACVASPAHAYLPPHTAVFESRAPPRA